MRKALAAVLVLAASAVWAQPAASFSKLAWIKAGTFLMGSPDTEPLRWDREGPQHRVTVAAFRIGVTEVTQAQYRAVMGGNPSYFQGDESRPVEQVSWFDAVNFCNKLSRIKGLPPAYEVNGTEVKWDPKARGYRLPTEAEWEYACRAGTTGPFWSGPTIGTDQANYNGLFPYGIGPKGLSRGTTVPVGSLKPNPWGLADMGGNVAEWCWDFYSDYSAEPSTNPRGPDQGTYRVLRGGAWNSYALLLRSACRVYDGPERQADSVGFRVALSAVR